MKSIFQAFSTQYTGCKENGVTLGLLQRSASTPVWHESSPGNRLNKEDNTQIKSSLHPAQTQSSIFVVDENNYLNPARVR